MENSELVYDIVVGFTIRGDDFRCQVRIRTLTIRTMKLCEFWRWKLNLYPTTTKRCTNIQCIYNTLLKWCAPKRMYLYATDM